MAKISDEAAGGILGLCTIVALAVGCIAGGLTHSWLISVGAGLLGGVVMLFFMAGLYGLSGD